MDQTAKIRIGYLRPEAVESSPTGGETYLRHFSQLLPPEIEMTCEGLPLIGSSRYDIGGKTDEITSGALEFTRKYDLQGLILAGAPLGILNPGLEAQVTRVVGISVVMAVPAVVAALKALCVSKLTVMTPWDDELNGRLKQRLLEDGLTVLSCPLFEDPTPGAGAKVSPEEIFRRVERAFAEAGEAEAIYFQGAPLNPIPIIQKLEDKLGVPVIASNPAMLWHVTSLLGHDFSIENYGSLLRSWPKTVG